MRTLFYILLFITPTILVLIFRQDIQDYLTKKGILGPDFSREAPGEVADPAGGGTPGEAPVPEEGVLLPEEGAEVVDEGDAGGESAIDAQVAAKYPLPQFESLERIVGNWRAVPERAYPEHVTLKQPLELRLMIDGVERGRSTLRVGQQVYPISLEGSRLIVSGSAGDTALRGEIDVDDTDFKDQIRKTYEAWKTRQAGRVHKLRKEEKQRLLAEEGGAESPETAVEVGAAERSAVGEKPEVHADGSIPVMVASIRAGEVKEIDLSRVDYWRWNGYEEIGGTGYWTGVVGYTAKTIFGDIQAEGKALIRNGKVVKWIYSGSEEEIR